MIHGKGARMGLWSSSDEVHHRDRGARTPTTWRPAGRSLECSGMQRASCCACLPSRSLDAVAEGHNRTRPCAGSRSRRQRQPALPAGVLAIMPPFVRMCPAQWIHSAVAMCTPWFGPRIPRAVHPDRGASAEMPPSLF